MSDDSGERIALITGASRGIGYFAALAYARAGYHVIAVARTVGGLEELDDAIQAEGGSTTLVPMDVTDYDAIDRLGAAIDKQWGRLDVLLANAGMLGGLSPLGHFDPKEFEKVLAVNVTANWRFIRSMDPLLRASEAGRMIIIGSGAAYSCRPFWGAYSVSKAAVHALGQTYAAECKNGPIRVNIANPSGMRTAMRALAIPGEDPNTLPHPSEFGDTLVMMGSPELTQNGLIFDFPTGEWQTPGVPSVI